MSRADDHVWRAGLGLLVALALPACALSADDGGDDGDSDGSTPCAVVVELSPAGAEAPIMLTARADEFGTAIGLRDYAWSVTGPGDPDITPRATPDFADVLAPEPGSYTVTVEVTIGSLFQCSDSATVQVLAPGAQTLDLRLRYTPRAEHGTPPQDDPAPLTIHGGADVILEGPRTLAPGIDVAGVLTGPSGGLAAQLTITPTGGGRAIDLYSDDTGGFSGQILGNETHRVVVVPYDYALAPVELIMQTASTIDAGWTFDAGDMVTGTALDSGGNPVAFAWVAVSSGDLPPTLAQTGMDGSFTARARSGRAPVRVRVTPAGSNHAAISATSMEPIAAGGSNLAITLPAPAPIATSVHVADAVGADLAGARVTFIADGAAGGAMTLGGGTPLAATVVTRRTVTVGAGGAAAVTLPAGNYTAIVEPPAGAAGQGITAVPVVVTGPIINVATAALAPLELQVKNASGALVAGARVTAVAGGQGGVGAGAAVSASTDDVAGAVTLGLSTGMVYDVVIEPPAGSGLARVRRSFTGGVAPAVPLVVELPRGLEIRGEVILPVLGGRSGVRVAAHCDGCATPDVVLGETVTTSGGKFRLVVQDPGVTP